MKDFISVSYIFTPGGSGIGTVDLKIDNFDIKRLVAIINQTRGIIIYNTADINNKFTAVNGSILTLNVDTSAQASDDILQVIYNDPAQDDLINTLYEAVRGISAIASAKGVLADLRTSIVGGTLPIVSTVGTVNTVSTITTLSNQTSIGGYSANIVIPAQTNLVAINANINNIIIT
jgi:hypothetical protein